MAKVKDFHLHLVIDDQMLKQIEHLRLQQQRKPSRSEMVRRMLIAGMVSLTSKKQDIAA